MDRDVRKAVRTIEQVGFQGLSIKELERFKHLSSIAILFQKYKLNVGDEVETNGCSRKHYGVITGIDARSAGWNYVVKLTHYFADDGQLEKVKGWSPEYLEFGSKQSCFEGWEIEKSSEEINRRKNVIK